METNAPVIRIQVLKKASEFESVRAEWERLGRNPEATDFQQFHWNRLAAEIFADREEPHVIIATRGEHAVILPLAIRRNGTAGLLGETLFDYRDLLSSGDPELERTVLAEAAQLNLDLDITALTPAATHRWNMFKLHPFTNAPRIVRANCTAEQLIESHRRLGRHSRRIAKRGAQFKSRNGADREFVRDLYARKATQQDSLFTDPVRRDFMERICHEEGNRCRIFTYETADDLVAAALTFQSDHACQFYTIYFDPDWSALSPGQVLLYEASVQVLCDGFDCDFLTGEYPYKTRLANDAVPLMRIQATATEWRDALVERKDIAA